MRLRFPSHDLSASQLLTWCLILTHFMFSRLSPTAFFAKGESRSFVSESGRQRHQQHWRSTFGKHAPRQHSPDVSKSTWQSYWRHWRSGSSTRMLRQLHTHLFALWLQQHLVERRNQIRTDVRAQFFVATSPRWTGFWGRRRI